MACLAESSWTGSPSAGTRARKWTRAWHDQIEIEGADDDSENPQPAFQDARARRPGIHIHRSVRRAASGVYAYEFTDGMWYIGKSVDVCTRHVQHMHEYRHEDPPRVPKRMLWGGGQRGRAAAARLRRDCAISRQNAETLVVRKGDDYDPRPLGFINMKLPESGKLPTWQDCGVPDHGTLPNAITMRIDTLEEGERLLHAEHALDACYRANAELIRRGASTPYSATGRARPLTAASRASPSVCPS